ncbi:MAG: copper resistance protein NlpE [Clostridia bacterium]|nr:copper resistance protein NlpE [Clostridia bacterium]
MEETKKKRVLPIIIPVVLIAILAIVALYYFVFSTNVKKELLGSWTLTVDVQGVATTATYTFEKDDTFHYKCVMEYKGLEETFKEESGTYEIDEENKTIKLKFDKENTGLKTDIPYFEEDGELIFVPNGNKTTGKYTHIK